MCTSLVFPVPAGSQEVPIGLSGERVPWSQNIFWKAQRLTILFILDTVVVA